MDIVNNTSDPDWKIKSIVENVIRGMISTDTRNLIKKAEVSETVGSPGEYLIDLFLTPYEPLKFVYFGPKVPRDSATL